MQFLRQRIIDEYSRGGEEMPHSIYAVVPRFFIFSLYLLLIEVIYYFIPGAVDYIVEHFTEGFLFFTFVMFVAFIIRPVITLFNSYHELASDYLISVQGFASFSRQEHLLPYEFIQGIEVRQNLFERFVEMGDLHIGTAMSGDVEIKIKHIERPHFYADKLQESINNAIEV